MNGDIVDRLIAVLGPSAVLAGDAAGERYRVDFSRENACAPLCVVRPASSAEIAATLRVCHAARQPVCVQGGLTGLVGGATPRTDEVVISTERLAGIEELDTVSAAATVLAGTPLQTVQEAAADAGLTFPLDLGARGSCTIGGNIATNAGGNQVIRFGMMRNLVLGLEAVLADGTIVSSMGKVLKNNAGYDVKQLFIGTEGTLGVVTRAVLKLVPKLPARTTALCSLPSFDAAVALLRTLQAALGGALSAYEAMWASYFDYVTQRIGQPSPFARQWPIYALIEIEGIDAAADGERLESVLGAALQHDTILDAAIAQSEREARAFWAIRDGIGDVTPTLQPLAAFDVSMSIDRMASFLEHVERELPRLARPATNLVFGHIGDGNLHLAMTTRDARDTADLAAIVYDAVGAHAGSISAEHGIGTLRRAYLHHSRTPEELALMRTLKTALDPHGILNRGRVLP